MPADYYVLAICPTTPGKGFMRQNSCLGRAIHEATKMYSCAFVKLILIGRYVASIQIVAGRHLVHQQKQDAVATMA